MDDPYIQVSTMLQKAHDEHGLNNSLFHYDVYMMFEFLNFPAIHLCTEEFIWLHFFLFVTQKKHLYYRIILFTCLCTSLCAYCHQLWTNKGRTTQDQDLLEQYIKEETNTHSHQSRLSDMHFSPVQAVAIYSWSCTPVVNSSHSQEIKSMHEPTHNNNLDWQYILFLTPKRKHTHLSILILVTGLVKISATMATVGE